MRTVEVRNQLHDRDNAQSAKPSVFELILNPKKYLPPGLPQYRQETLLFLARNSDRFVHESDARKALILNLRECIYHLRLMLASHDLLNHFSIIASHSHGYRLIDTRFPPELPTGIRVNELTAYVEELKPFFTPAELEILLQLADYAGCALPFHAFLTTPQTVVRLVCTINNKIKTHPELSHLEILSTTAGYMLRDLRNIPEYCCLSDIHSRPEIVAHIVSSDLLKVLVFLAQNNTPISQKDLTELFNIEEPVSRLKKIFSKHPDVFSRITFAQPKVGKYLLVDVPDYS